MVIRARVGACPTLEIDEMPIATLRPQRVKSLFEESLAIEHGRPRRWVDEMPEMDTGETARDRAAHQVKRGKYRQTLVNGVRAAGAFLDAHPPTM